MEKNSVTPKAKLPPPSSSSEEELESSEEETEDEEQAEGGSGLESGSAESTEAPTPKLINILPPKQQSLVKAAGLGSPAKRTREAKAKKDKEDEPQKKKKKLEVATPAPKAAPKQLDKKSANKAEKGKQTPPSKEKPLKDPAAEDTKKSTKRKSKSAGAAKATTSRVENETPLKPKAARPWSPEEELALSKEMQKDRMTDVVGSSLPSSKLDPYWESLLSRCPCMEQYEKEIRTERLREKVRRMRLRYVELDNRVKTGEPMGFRKSHEKDLWPIWQTIWGPNKATPNMLNGDDEEEDEEEEEGESDDDGADDDEADEDEDEEEEEIVTTQDKGRVTTQQNVRRKKVLANQSSSDDDESSEEDSPVKATPPAVQAIPATATTFVAGTPAPASNSAPPKYPASTATDGGSGKISRIPVIPAVIEKAVGADAGPKVSDEIRAENLVVLRDLRSTCVKMVDEAKMQSLFIADSILGETRVKATQILDEARMKTAQIMEELRLIVERSGTVTGGRTNDSQAGCWNGLSDNPFQGTDLFGTPPPLGDPDNNLDAQWRKQREAEQGLFLQRLQLVQEQARILQDGIKLRQNHPKQQS